MGMQTAKEKLAEHIEAAVASLSGFGERAMPLIVIARYIKERKT
jgi:geranylgeranyl diphosphate synthase type II